MSGGVGSKPANIQPGEKLWRLIEYSWFQPDVSGRYVVEETAFIGQISLIRAAHVSENDVDTFLDKNGNHPFIKYGIAVLDADEIVSKTGGTLLVTSDPYGWPSNAHVEFRRSSGGKELRAKHAEVSDLTDLANANPLVRSPKS